MSAILNLPRNFPGGFRKNHPVLLKKETLFTELQKIKYFDEADKKTNVILLKNGIKRVINQDTPW